MQFTQEFVNRSARVKACDFHPTTNLLLCTLHTGDAQLWDHQTHELLSTVHVSDCPIRCCKFIDRESTFICGGDDLQCHVYTFPTVEKITSFPAHEDFVRCIDVHAAQPYVLTGGDDHKIKLWDWSRCWLNIAVYNGHNNYVMSVAFNPNDSNTFASASLDKTVKVWNITSGECESTLVGHEKGINCVAYQSSTGKPYLASGSDDHTLKVWDYEAKECVQTVEGHTHNVSAVLFHPSLPIIVSASEDESVKVCNSSTYEAVTLLQLSLKRVWATATKGTKLAFGCDDGIGVVDISSLARL